MARARIDLEGDPSIEKSQSQVLKDKVESLHQWFENTCVESKDKILAVCAVTARMMIDQFDVRVRINNDETYALIFYVTFMVLLQFMKKKREQFSEFEVQIAMCVILGYTNFVDKDDEKVGNFMPFMEWVGEDKSIVYNPNETRDDNFIRWKKQNSTKNADMYHEIQDRAAWIINHNYGLNVGSPEIIIPAFCIFLDNVISILRIDYKDLNDEASKVSMNVLGLFTVTYSFDDDADGSNKEIIDFSPSVEMKMELKNDATAEAKA